MKTTSRSTIILVTTLIVLAIGVLGYAGYRAYKGAQPVDIAVQLTDAERKDFEAKLAYFSEQLKIPDPNSPIGLPNHDFFIEKARYLGYLGHLSQAEAVLKETLEKFKYSQVAEHNLGRLYEQMKKYDKAIDCYERLVDAGSYNQQQYYFDIARVYRIQNDVSNADKAYHSFLKKFNTPDAEFEQWLRDNKK